MAEMHDTAWNGEREVDLTNCDREPIHILGAIQDFGFLLALSADWLVVRASENVGQWLPGSVDDILGQPLGEIVTPEAMDTIRRCVHGLSGPDGIERAFGVVLRPDGEAFDLAVHLSGGAIVVEAEPAEHKAGFNSGMTVRGMIDRMHRSTSIERLLKEAARQMRVLTGFDRVMVYRFREDEAGEVVAEAARSHMTPYLGLNYPATDIPKQARALYLRNWLRIIADVGAEPSPIRPARNPEGAPLDLSMSALRAVSPIHVEYLRNMGVGASLSISIVVDGKLWGLFACHHEEPRRISYERRTAAELFGQIFSLLLAGREREDQHDHESTARVHHDRLMSAMAANGDPQATMAEFLDDFGEMIDCSGVGLWMNGEATLKGRTPTREEFAELVRFLNRGEAAQVYATDEIGRVFEPARDYAERAAGLLAVPLSRSPRDYVVFFRNELARNVRWAGDPEKPVTVGPNGARLTPRKSFEAWTQTVRGRSAPWSAADIRIAQSLRLTLLEVVLRLTDAAEKDRRGQQERQELLIAELNHRVRNILGLIRGLVSQSKRPDISASEFAEVVGGRVHALARAHDQITEQNWSPGSLRKLIQQEAAAFLENGASRVRVKGPSVLLEPQAFSTVALVIHELTTNAAKYGALCDSTGEVNVSWRFLDDDALELAWRETGGPAVKAPNRRGFGSTIIERSIPFDLGGEAEVRYELTGLVASFRIPAPHVIAGKEDDVAPEEVPLGHSRLSGTVLGVEDNMIIAMELQMMLEDLGADRVMLASSASEALRLVEAEPPTFAVLDVNLGGETSLVVAEALVERDVPFLFATGYGESVKLPEAMADVRIIKKPYTDETMREGITGARQTSSR